MNDFRGIDLDAIGLSKPSGFTALHDEKQKKTSTKLKKGRERPINDLFTLKGLFQHRSYFTFAHLDIIL